MSDPRILNESNQDDIEQLLPWFVSGRLDAAEKQAVEGYLAAHPAMRSQLELIEAEQAATTANNEAIAPPPADQLSKLMQHISADATRSSPFSALASFVQHALDWLGDRSALVPVACAAAVALLLQAGVIGAWVWQGSAAGPGRSSYQTASVHALAAPDTGTYAMAGFAPAATADQIEQTLSSLGVTIADGPKAGGIYKLRLADKPLGERDRDMLVTALRAQSGVVRFVAPAAP